MSPAAPTAPAAEAPAWFHNQVVAGLQFLWALGLPGTPAGEVATLTATAWVQALWGAARWQQDPDAPRLAEAFRTVAARSDRWPAPRNVLDAMPARPAAPAIAYRHGLPPPELRGRIDQLLRRTATTRTEPAA